MPASSTAARACTSEATCPLWTGFRAPVKMITALGVSAPAARARALTSSIGHMMMKSLMMKSLGNFPADQS